VHPTLRNSYAKFFAEHCQRRIYGLIRPNEDELFLVVKGTLKIELRDGHAL
jgi:hypothetical protein